MTTSSKWAQLARGYRNSIVLGIRRPPRIAASEALIVAGYPRSGTTWLAELLAARRNIGVMFEPLSPEHVRQARAAGLDWMNFHLPGDHWPEGESFLEDVLAGRIVTAWTSSAMTLQQALNVERWLIKMVRANQMLGWIVEKFGTRPPALIVRHPCAVLASREARGWPTPEFAPNAQSFFSAYPEFTGYIKSRQYPEEHFATRWCMHHFAPLSLPKPYPFVLVFYEDLLRDPVTEVGRICAAWQMDPPANLAEASQRPSMKASAETADGNTRLNRWMGRLGHQRAGRIVAVLKEFGLDFYTESEWPVRQCD